MQKDQLLFISHSKNDDKIALALCDYLESNGLQCWISPRDNFAGKLYGASIIEGINFSKIMIVILSKSSNNSDSVISEVERAFDKKIDLVTFKIDKTIISSSLEFFLSSKQWLDASNGNPKDYFPEVLRTCNGLLNDDTINYVKKSVNTTQHKNSKLEIFINSNKKVVLFFTILGLGLLVYSFVWRDMSKTKSNPDIVEMVTDSIEENKNDGTTKSDSEASINVQKDPEVVTPIKVNEQNGTTKEPFSSAKLEENDLNNVKFDNVQSNDYIQFHMIQKGVYNFEGRISKSIFSGKAKFEGNSTYKIINSTTIKGNFYVYDNQITGSFTLLEDNFTPPEFLLFKN